MSIQVKIFYTRLMQAMRNPAAVTVNGSTIGKCLADLTRQYPAAETLIFDKQGQLMKSVYVFVNAESLHKQPMDKPVREGDTLIIALLITGG